MSPQPDLMALQLTVDKRIHQECPIVLLDSMLAGHGQYSFHYIAMRAWPCWPHFVHALCAFTLSGWRCTLPRRLQDTRPSGQTTTPVTGLLPAGLPLSASENRPRPAPKTPCQQHNCNSQAVRCTNPGYLSNLKEPLLCVNDPAAVAPPWAGQPCSLTPQPAKR